MYDDRRIMRASPTIQHRAAAASLRREDLDQRFPGSLDAVFSAVPVS